MSLEKDEKPVILDEESFSTPLNVTSDEDQEEKGDSVPPTPVSSVPADPSPDGGSKAWLQVLGSFFLFFNSWGLVNSFGVFQTYYETGLLSHESPSDISWIGSIQAFLLLIVGAASGPTYDAGYFYALVWTGSFLIVFGIMMTSLCTQYWQVMLSQGICLGLGSGCKDTFEYVSTASCSSCISNLCAVCCYTSSIFHKQKSPCHWHLD